jgi:hypothetical protein
MGLSARVPSTTDTNLFIPKIYSNKVEEAVKSNLVAWGAIDSSWQSELTKGDILYIPKSNTVTATEVVVGTKGTTLNPLNTTGVTLTINQWYEAPVDIDYMSIRQKGADPEGVASTEAGYAINVRMDTAVCTLFSSLGGYSTSAYGTDGQTLTDDLLLYLVETLDESNVPRDGNRSLIIDPAALIDMLKIDKFIASQYVNIGAVTNGEIGKSPIYSCTVRVTNNLVAATTGNYACMLHKKAIAGAAQIDKTWVKEYEDLHLRRYQAETLFGVIELNDAFGIPFFTRKS